MKKGFVVNIEKETLQNKDYRRVLYTSKKSQLVLMSIMPGDEIGEEVHDLDQFIRVERGKATLIINDNSYQIEDDFVAVIPEGTKHNVINTGSEPLKLYSIYSPPEHKEALIHKSKSDENNEHFDGITSE